MTILMIFIILGFVFYLVFKKKGDELHRGDVKPLWHVEEDEE